MAKKHGTPRTHAATPVAAVAASCGATELLIEIGLHDTTHWQGTREQLVGEGLIPEWFVWPKGLANRHWTAGGFDYQLRRCKPRGMKGGPAKLWWIECDHWLVHRSRLGVDHVARRIERMQDEVARLERLQTDDGKREMYDRIGLSARSVQIAKDAPFQAFKRKVLSFAL